ncbi:MAG: hypothetical protein ACR2P4_01925 [Gammaproteobacteria bacterium]
MTENKSLPYEMGNAGDLIKHGALALFVQWWCENNPTEVLRFADPFGGCPQKELENDKSGNEIKRRLNELATYSADVDGFNGAAIAGCLWDGDTYHNSGHIVAKAVREYGKTPEVWTSDKCRDRREQLEESRLCMLHKKYGGYQCDDGYSILSHAGDFDLVLIDPFRKFWEEPRKGQLPSLAEIKQKAEENKDVCLAVFLVGNHVFGEYNRMKKHLDIAISLRCPRISGSVVCGEKGKAEILLLSQTFASKGRELHKCLAKFGKAAQKVLPLGGREIELCPLK